MRTKSWLSGVVAAVAFAALLGAPRFAGADPPAPAPAPAPAACGTSDNPCPLQKWMRENHSKKSLSNIRVVSGRGTRLGDDVASSFIDPLSPGGHRVHGGEAHET